MSEITLHRPTVERPPAVARPWSAGRVWGYIFVLFWIVVGIGFVWYLAASWNPELVEKYQTYLAETPGSDEVQALRKARMKMIKSKSEYSNPWYWAIYKDED